MTHDITHLDRLHLISHLGLQAYNPAKPIETESFPWVSGINVQKFDCQEINQRLPMLKKWVLPVPEHYLFPSVEILLKTSTPNIPGVRQNSYSVIVDYPPNNGVPIFLGFYGTRYRSHIAHRYIGWMHDGLFRWANREVEAIHGGSFGPVVGMFQKAIYILHLMLCKNVAARDVIPDEALNRARIRRGKPPKLAYKKLFVDLGATPGKSSSKSAPGAEIPLHLARGHIKTYTAEAPLFGQHVGSWFWAPHTRGDIKHGEIKKDYELRCSGDLPTPKEVPL